MGTITAKVSIQAVSYTQTPGSTVPVIKIWNYNSTNATLSATSASDAKYIGGHFTLTSGTSRATLDITIQTSTQNLILGSLSVITDSNGNKIPYHFGDIYISNVSDPTYIIYNNVNELNMSSFGMKRDISAGNIASFSMITLSPATAIKIDSNVVKYSKLITINLNLALYNGLSIVIPDLYSPGLLVYDATNVNVGNSAIYSTVSVVNGTTYTKTVPTSPFFNSDGQLQLVVKSGTSFNCNISDLELYTWVVSLYCPSNYYKAVAAGCNTNKGTGTIYSYSNLTMQNDISMILPPAPTAITPH